MKTIKLTIPNQKWSSAMLEFILDKFGKILLKLTYWIIIYKFFKLIGAL